MQYVTSIEIVCVFGCVAFCRLSLRLFAFFVSLPDAKSLCEGSMSFQLLSQTVELCKKLESTRPEKFKRKYFEDFRFLWTAVLLIYSHGID